MFRDSYKPLTANKIDTLIKIINPKITTSPFESAQTKAISHSLPFYPAFQFVEMRKANANPPLKLNLFAPIDYKNWDEENVCLLDGTNSIFYRLNKEIPILLNKSTVHSYVTFFFAYVRGAQGQFQILSSIDDIQWHEAPGPSGIKALSKMIAPLKIIEQNDDEYILKSTILFKDSLFESDIHVAQNGMIALKDQKILVEDLPVVDQILS